MGLEILERGKIWQMISVKKFAEFGWKIEGVQNLKYNESSTWELLIRIIAPQLFQKLDYSTN